MVNKVIIGILVLLVVLMGGSGYYSYTLNQQIDDLGEQLTAFETEQTARIDAMSDELGELRQETDSLDSRIEGVQSEVDTLDSELGAIKDLISGVED
ncbi:MAG: hypothetical protein KAW90_06465, partial [Dehalococcoidales bacterium]|nr:hypothetical protein [Dehalococcoidales bacterium]